MPCYTYADQKLEIGHHSVAWKEGVGGVGGVSHGFQRKWRGNQSSLTEFKGGTKENWRLMR